MNDIRKHEDIARVGGALLVVFPIVAAVLQAAAL